MIHNDVARRTVREFPSRSLGARRSPARTLACDGPAVLNLRPPRALVRTLGARPLGRLAEGGRLEPLPPHTP
ncbi:hypothetical protein GCM10009665_18770 [Kitasatospora nipponensis]|uniref:Uncharacterized protein n=1 Tax=Kitasatospora nipponensis TaxID=258049 RepID=A0ABN1W4R7_9ACTN